MKSPSLLMSAIFWLSFTAQTTIVAIRSLDEVEARLRPREGTAHLNGSIIFLVDIDGVLFNPISYIDYSSLDQAAQGQQLLSEQGNNRKMVRIIRGIDQQQYVLGFTERSAGRLLGSDFTGQELLQTSLALSAAEFRGERFKAIQTLHMPLARFPSRPAMRKLETTHGLQTTWDASQPAFDEDFKPYAIVTGVTPRAPIICQNVIYTNYIKKEYALFLLLRQHFARDTALNFVVAIDDQLDSLAHMEHYVSHYNRLSGTNVGFLGLHYYPHTQHMHHSLRRTTGLNRTR